MSVLVYIVAQILLAVLMIALIVFLIAWSVWHLVYYVFGSKNPIGKTAAVSAVAIWIISAGILSMM